MSRIRESQVISDFFHTGIGVDRLPFCFKYDPLLNMMAGSIAGNSFYDLIQVIRAYSHIDGISRNFFYRLILLLKKLHKHLHPRHLSRLNGDLQNMFGFPRQVGQKYFKIPDQHF